MPTTLVLLPGLDGTGALFDSFVDALPAEVVPWVIAYPGDEALSYPDLLAYIADRLPPEPCAVLGESFSGPLALRLAGTDRRIRAVILCATFVTNPLRHVPRSAAHFVFPFLLHLFPAFARARMLLGGYSTAALRASLRRAHRLATPRVFAERLKAVLRVDARAELVSCPVPILYLAGENDRVVRRHNSAAVRRLRPDVEIVSVAAPHLVLQVAPSRAAAAVVSFLERAAMPGETHP